MNVCQQRAARNAVPELLAPAGDLSSALAAFDSGADAVYAGLKKFNARERSGNFTEEQYGMLIDYAHDHGKKVYTTFNTVIKESEIREAADTLACLHYLRPDAVIVQDFGVVRMIREFFPELVMHGSTQMALHNSDDLAVAAEAGIRRVILERQTTLEEIRLLAQKSPVEIELFIHGALCACLSGTCLLSSWFGGASGNRGKCKQPCRRLFRSDSGREAFYLSTKDMAAGALIPEFRKMGIASLKIEGRLRKPDYVAKVTQAYRLLLDAPENDFPEALHEAEEILSRTASRQPSMGFYTVQAAKTVINSAEPGGIGQFCGKVRKVLPDAFEAELSRRIHVGDTIRIQSQDGDNGETLSILSLSVNGKKSVKAFPGQHCIIGAKGKNIVSDGVLYRIGEISGSFEKRASALPPFKPALDMDISLTKDGIGAVFPQFPELVWKEDLSLETAAKHAFTEEELLQAFASIGETPFRPGRVNCRMEGKLFLPKSVLKEVRRKFRAWSAENFPLELFRERSQKQVRKLWDFYEGLSARFPDEKQEIRIDDRSGNVLPFFVPETQMDLFHERLSKALQGKDLVWITSIGQFRHKAEFPGLHAGVFAPLPLANSFAALEFARMGADRGLIHMELGQADMELLAGKSPLRLAQYVSGRPVLFATRAGVDPAAELKASDGQSFLVQRNGLLTMLVPEHPVRIPEIPGADLLYDFRYLPEDEQSNDTSEFNFSRGLS